MADQIGSLCQQHRKNELKFNLRKGKKMSINSISPTTFTTGVLITDTIHDPNGSNDAIEATITPGAALDIQSTQGVLVVPRMNLTQANDLPIEDGGIFYDTDNARFTFAQSGAFITPIAPILEDNTNLFVGTQAGNETALEQSSATVLIGTDVGLNITAAQANTGVGSGAIEQLIDGGNNTAIGADALAEITHGVNNTAVGTSALENGVDLIQCTAVGFTAGETHNHLTSCTFIGFGADCSADTLTNATAIGAQASVGSSNSLVLGSTGLGTNVGIGINSPTSKLHVVSAGNAINCQGAFLGKVTPNAGTPYNIAANDFIIAQTATASAISLVLPAITAGNTGIIYRIKDQSGAANTHNITISTTGGKTIDGAATNVISTAFGKVSIYNDGTQWYTI